MFGNTGSTLSFQTGGLMGLGQSQAGNTFSFNQPNQLGGQQNQQNLTQLPGQAPVSCLGLTPPLNNLSRGVHLPHWRSTCELKQAFCVLQKKVAQVSELAACRGWELPLWNPASSASNRVSSFCA